MKYLGKNEEKNVVISILNLKILHEDVIIEVFTFIRGNAFCESTISYRFTRFFKDASLHRLGFQPAFKRDEWNLPADNMRFVIFVI